MQVSYVVESWRPDSSDGSSKVSTRIMIREWNPTTNEHEWRYKRHTFNDWDWAIDAKDNHRKAINSTIQKDLNYHDLTLPMTHAGDTVRGYLWVVTISV